MKNISILGATGSIGTQAIQIIKDNKDKFNLKAISVGSNIKVLEEILNTLSPKLVSVKSKEDYEILSSKYKNIKFWKLIKNAWNFYGSHI